MSLSSEHKHAATVEIALLQTVLCKQMDQVSVTSVTNATILMKINQNCPNFCSQALDLFSWYESNQTKNLNGVVWAWYASMGAKV